MNMDWQEIVWENVIGMTLNLSGDHWLPLPIAELDSACLRLTGQCGIVPVRADEISGIIRYKLAADGETVAYLALGSHSAAETLLRVTPTRNKLGPPPLCFLSEANRDVVSFVADVVRLAFATYERRPRAVESTHDNRAMSPSASNGRLAPPSEDGVEVNLLGLRKHYTDLAAEEIFECFQSIKPDGVRRRALGRQQIHSEIGMDINNVSRYFRVFYAAGWREIYGIRMRYRPRKAHTA